MYFLPACTRIFRFSFFFFFYNRYSYHEFINLAKKKSISNVYHTIDTRTRKDDMFNSCELLLYVGSNTVPTCTDLEKIK